MTTTNRIEALRTEAAAAGDHDAVAICTLALDGVIDLDEHPHISLRLAKQIIGGTMDGDVAHQRCLTMLADADGQAVRS